MANPIFHSQYTAAQIEDLIENGAPIIQNGYWWRWDVATQQYVNTNITADSETAADAAEAAQAAAEYAQGKAEDAQEAAETAQGLAEGARDAAAASAASIAASAAQIAANTARINYVALREEEDRQILFGSVVEAAEDSYPELRSAPIHTAITIGQSVYPRMDRTRMAIDRILGRTVAFNQLVTEARASTTVYDLTLTRSDDGGKLTISGTPNTTGNITVTALGVSVLKDHVYLASVGFESTADTFGIFGYASIPTGKSAIISKASADNTLAINVHVTSGVAVNITVIPQCFDLTAQYGTTLADSIYATEQATAGAGVAYVRQRIDLDYYAANAGELVAPVVSGVSFVGFNLWDEEWEVGSIGINDGQNSISSATIRSINYNPCIGGATYYGKIPTGNVIALFYDADKNYLTWGYITNRELAAPSNAAFFRIRVEDGYGTTYHNDICINLSSSRNGEYQPYQHASLSLPSTRLDGVGSAQDYIEVVEDGENDYSLHLHKVMGEVDLGAQIWTKSTSYANPFFYTNAVIHDTSVGITCVCDSYVAVANCAAVAFGNNAPNKSVAMQIDSDNQVYIRDDSYTDAATFTTAMSGKKLVYKLKTPTETVIAEHLTLAEVSAIAENGGIISVTNENGHIVQPDFVADVVISRSAS